MLEPWPIVTNSGGVVDPHDLVGRPAEVDRLVRATRTGGAKLLGERRIGKTSILRAVEQRLRAEGATVVRVSAETDDPAEFGRDLLAGLRKSNRIRDALRRCGDVELTLDVGPFGARLTTAGSQAAAPPELFRLCAEAVGSAHPDRFVLLFDEITTLARALERRGPGSAASFFHSLRRPRQEIAGISMILAGSIGLHHVLHDMSPVNDLDGVPIGPLDRTDAVLLARCLLLGIRHADDRGLAADIAEQAAGVPFYIHKIVQEIAEGWVVRGAADLDALVTNALRTNQWGTEHDLTRIAENFGDDADRAIALLDILAMETEPMSIEQMGARLDVVDLALRPDRNGLISIVDRLEDDHYLTRVGDGSSFSHPLQRRIWRTIRRLS